MASISSTFLHFLNNESNIVVKALDTKSMTQNSICEAKNHPSGFPDFVEPKVLRSIKGNWCKPKGLINGYFIT
jgi:hypothetical protein